MESEFILENEEIVGVYNEKTIVEHSFNSNMGFIKVLITQEKNKEDNYFNVYIIDDHFKREPINCLRMQEPKTVILKKFKNPLKYFDEKKCEIIALEHYLWYKYNSSFYIQEEEL